MNKKEEQHLSIMHTFFLLILFLCIFSLTSFALQFMHSNNFTVNIEQTYGIFQNNVFFDSKEVLLASPYAVQKKTIVLKNSLNQTREVYIAVNYQGLIIKTIPDSQNNTTTLVWGAAFSPFEEKSFEIIGRNFELEPPLISETPFTFSGNVSNKKLILNDSNQTNDTIPFVRKKDSDNIFEPFSRQRKDLDLTSKILVILFGGLVILIVAGGIGTVFGKKPPKITKKPNIHISSIYPGEEKEDILTKYKYSETDYWK